MQPQNQQLPKGPCHSRSIGHSQILDDKLEASFVPSQVGNKAVGKGSLTSRHGSMSHRDSVPIGPQKSKNQQQANPKMQGGDLGILAEMDEAVLTKAAAAKENHNEREDSKSTISSDSQKNGPIERKSVAQVFEERVAQWKLKTKAELVARDQLEFDDPHVVADCAQQIYESLRAAEAEFQVDPGYLQKTQTEIKDTSRAFLIEWIIDVHRKFRLAPESLYVTQHVIDQFLSRQPIQKSQLHLLGVTTLHIAAKYEEIYPPDLRDFLAVSENKFSK